ncbi:hypothetical protein [Sphingobacterium daejeonense]|uniref:hypothetical protein n=1 Tax=Sphingobacterium daejeonense TaxID=371142 RepID=UPI0010C497EB|nr:hypothetical protein [Sphingobacterium daejeonense]VTQ01812.1 Uncharacterised protein [Sphingobacterium daejeonense]
MGFKPILFSTQMVEAILDGRKTQTRRIIKSITPEAITKLMYLDLGIEVEKYKSELIRVDAKFRIGDILWVREAWNSFDSSMVPYVYRASDLKSIGHKWKPSILMPFDAARIFLKVKNIKVEKLQYISEKDAISEGIDNHIDDEGKHQFYIYPVKEKKIFKDNSRFGSFM